MLDSSSHFTRQISNNLLTNLIGRKLYHYNTLDSTQRLANKLAKDNQDESNGAVILADFQTDGYGRNDKRWIGPEGGIWLSIILTPKMPAIFSFALQSASALAVGDAINKSGLISKVKWPNDITINGKKVAGILTDITIQESSIRSAVIGIGVNANNDPSYIRSKITGDIHYEITSLKSEHGGNAVNKVDFCTALLQRMEYYYFQLEKGGHTYILDALKERMSMLGKKIRVKSNNRVYEATAMDVNPDGALVVKEIGEDEKKELISGDVIVLEL
jgi:BirA family biotin operon repressor/biotin-[acetyl-CoA-carboxylase] ligase